ncbi:MAG: hypothetical protein ACP5IL_17225 [Syntrophobacteraceae bacterium]
MRKTLIVGIAIAMLLVSGGLFSAQANCGAPSLSFLSPCNWRIPSFCGLGCHSKDVSSTPLPDADSQGKICQGAYPRGPSSPDVMGTGGF